MDDNQFNKQLEKLKKRIPQEAEMTEENYVRVLTDLLEDSFSIAMNELFPYKKVLPELLPSRYENWQIRVCQYIHSNAEFLGLMSYEENGIKISFSSDNIPNSIMNELIPYAGAPN